MNANVQTGLTKQVKGDASLVDTTFPLVRFLTNTASANAISKTLLGFVHQLITNRLTNPSLRART